MLELKKLAITGGFASGKSSICQFLKEKGAYVVSADQVVHTILSNDQTVQKQVESLLGRDVFVGNQIDRSKVAKKVFGDKKLLKNLENIIHPKVRDIINAQYEEIRQSKKYPLFAAEVPLLFESGMDQDYDMILLVIADDEKCERRCLEQLHISKEDFARRTARLASEQEKIEKSDYIIYNNGSLSDLRKETNNIYNILTGDRL